MESLNLQVVAVLMPLEIKLHMIHYLKALTHSIEYASGQGFGSTFMYVPKLLSAKVLIFLQTKAKERKHLHGAVPTAIDA